MIGFLRGKIASKQPPLLVLDVQGVGYEVEAPMSTFYQFEATTDEIMLLTHMHVREDAMLLYGFATESERILFKTLLKVNGVGAKMALAVLSALSVAEFCQSVDQADINTLTKIPGVGKKTAERLQIEMRDRLKPIIESGQLSAYAPTFSAEEPQTTTQGTAQIKRAAIEALESLGYKTSLAEKMVGSAFQEGLPLEAIIKRALQEVKLT